MREGRNARVPQSLPDCRRNPPSSISSIEVTPNTLKRDYIRVTPLPDGETASRLIGTWIEDYNTNHPHSGLKMRSPREFIAAETATA
jgi:transposase InsO family protein